MLEEKASEAIRYARQAVLVPEPDMTLFDMVVGNGSLFRSTWCWSLACDPDQNMAILVTLDSATLDSAKDSSCRILSELLEGSIAGTGSGDYQRLWVGRD
jgi:hypothetical protein